jgi:hypothetical protein
MGARTSLGSAQVEQFTIAASPSAEMSLPASALDFARVLFSKNGRVQSESCCRRCNFRTPTWVDNFDTEERQHEAECQGARSE